MVGYLHNMYEALGLISCTKKNHDNKSMCQAQLFCLLLTDMSKFHCILKNVDLRSKRVIEHRFEPDLSI